MAFKFSSEGSKNVTNYIVSTISTKDFTEFPIAEMRLPALKVVAGLPYGNFL